MPLSTKSLACLWSCMSQPRTPIKGLFGQCDIAKDSFDKIPERWHRVKKKPLIGRVRPLDGGSKGDDVELPAARRVYFLGQKPALEACVYGDDLNAPLPPGQHEPEEPLRRGDDGRGRVRRPARVRLVRLAGGSAQLGRGRDGPPRGLEGLFEGGAGRRDHLSTARRELDRRDVGRGLHQPRAHVRVLDHARGEDLKKLQEPLVRLGGVRGRRSHAFPNFDGQAGLIRELLPQKAPSARDRGLDRCLRGARGKPNDS
mmetsp:Transcript_21767/g.49225  ORF Transcript_21767/g.49225 Transcript_21767/m.49225 type:complete len:257 (+) Transcript_21767:216-986(+)